MATSPLQQASLFPDEPSALQHLAGLRRQLSETLQQLSRQIDDVAAAVERDEPRRTDARALAGFFADAVDVAKTSPDLGAAAKLVASLTQVGCADAKGLREQFIGSLAERRDLSYRRLRAIACDLDLDEDEVIADESPAMVEALARAAVRDGEMAILEAPWAEEVDWSTCDPAALRRFLSESIELVLTAIDVGQEVPWEHVKIGLDDIAPAVFPDPLDRAEWLLLCFDRTMEGARNSDLAEMWTERVTDWLFSNAPSSHHARDQARLRRARALLEGSNAWRHWLEEDAMESAQAELRQLLGESDDDERVDA